MGRSPAFGEGSVRLGSVEFDLFLGEAYDGKTAGSLSLRLDAPTTNAYDPRSLKYCFDRSRVHVLPDDYDPGDENHPISQIKTPQGLVTVVPQPGGYQVRFSAVTNIGYWTNGTYTYNPDYRIATWVVGNPNPGTSNRIEISKSSSTEEKTWTYEWNGADWRLLRPDGAVEYRSVTWSTNTYPIRSERFSTFASGGEDATFVRTRYFTLFPGFTKLTAESFNALPDVLIGLCSILFPKLHCG